MFILRIVRKSRTHCLSKCSASECKGVRQILLPLAWRRLQTDRDLWRWHQCFNISYCSALLGESWGNSVKSTPQDEVRKKMRSRIRNQISIKFTSVVSQNTHRLGSTAVFINTEVQISNFIVFQLFEFRQDILVIIPQILPSFKSNVCLQLLP